MFNNYLGVYKVFLFHVDFTQVDILYDFHEGFAWLFEMIQTIFTWKDGPT